MAEETNHKPYRLGLALSGGGAKGFAHSGVFLFPWAVRVADLGGAGLLSIAVFFVILVLGLVYAWRKGALEWK